MTHSKISHDVASIANKNAQKAMKLLRRNRKATLITAVGFTALAASTISSVITLIAVRQGILITALQHQAAEQKELEKDVNELKAHKKNLEEELDKQAKRRAETTERPSLPPKYRELEEEKQERSTAEKPETRKPAAKKPAAKKPAAKKPAAKKPAAAAETK